jgi:hypothetical protein
MRAGLLVIAVLAAAGFIAVAFVMPSMAGGIKVAPRNDPKYGELQWIVSENGIIRGWNKDNALEVTITPVMQSGKPAWSCRGYPGDAMPPSCGGKN